MNSLKVVISILLLALGGCTNIWINGIQDAQNKKERLDAEHPQLVKAKPTPEQSPKKPEKTIQNEVNEEKAEPVDGIVINNESLVEFESLYNEESPTKQNNKELENYVKDLSSFYQIVDQLNLDGYGNLMVDAQTHQALKTAFLQLGNLAKLRQQEQLDAGMINQIKALLQDKMPSILSGTQAANLLENYYYYRLEEQKLLSDNSNQNPITPEQSQKALKKLQREYLGSDAEKLFGSEDLANELTQQLIELVQNNQLSPEEKQQQRELIEEKLKEAYAAMQPKN